MKRFLTFLIAGVFSVLLISCSEKMPTHRYTQSDAEKKFLKICREDNKLPVQLFESGNTIWIYLPMEEELINQQGSLKNDLTKSKRKFLLNTFEGEHKDTQYLFLLDLTDGIKTDKDQGIKSDVTEKFIKNRLTIYGAISEAFFDINELPGDRKFANAKDNKTRQDMLENYIPKGKEPEFIGIVITDIKKGLAYKTVLNLHDYKLYRSEVLTPDEYNLREISELYGNAHLVGDKEGKNIEIKPIIWSWFFIEQIKNRVNFKFLRSDFPPNQDMIIEIASIIADTFRYYQYVDYSNVLIKDLREKASYNFNQPQISSFEETANKVRTPSVRMQYLATPGQTAH